MKTNKGQPRLHYLLLIPVALFIFGVIDMVVLFAMGLLDMLAQRASSDVMFSLIDLSALASVISFSCFLIYSLLTQGTSRKEPLNN